MKNLRHIFLTFFVLILFQPAISESQDVSPIVSTEWLQQNLSNPKLVLLDVRKVEEYKRGTYPRSDQCILWDLGPDKRGTFESVSELKEIAEKTVGPDKSKPIITYCDAGKCCPTWAFIFRYVLGYTDVKLYDGGMEEWSKNPALPLTR